MTRARDRLIDAAMRLFAETGTRTVSISHLARAAVVARGTIYSHFPDFEHLFDIVSQDVAERLDAEVTQRWRDVTLPHERIALYMAMILKHAHEDPAFGRYMVRFAPSTSSLHRAWADLLPKEVKNCIDQRIMMPFADGIAYYIQLLAGGTYSFIMLVVEGRTTWRDASNNLISLCLSAGGILKPESARVAEMTIERMERDLNSVPHRARFTQNLSNSTDGVRRAIEL